MATVWHPPPFPSPNLRTVLAYMSANERGDERMLRDTFDETLEHHILPKSLARPMLSLNLYMDYFRYYHNMFEKPIQRTIRDLIEAGDHFIIHLEVHAKSVTGETYHNEFMVVLRMMSSSTGDGSRKIGLVREFVDSMASKNFFPAEIKRIRARAQAAEAQAQADTNAAASSSHSRSNTKPRR